MHEVLASITGTYTCTTATALVDYETPRGTRIVSALPGRSFMQIMAINEKEAKLA